MSPEEYSFDQKMISFWRFTELLPKGPDPDLTILKGHLLIEERLRELIDFKLPFSQALEDAHLSAYQVICLAESFFSQQTDPWLWDVLKKLNKLRNDIAHKIEPSSIDQRMKEISATVKITIYPETGFGIDHPFIEFWLSLWVIDLCLIILREIQSNQTLKDVLREVAYVV
jgi:hypothetical protein